MKVIQGVVRGMSQCYADGTERQEFHFGMAYAPYLPAVDGQRVPITLVVCGVSYQAGLRRKPDVRYIWISPNLLLDGKKVSLASVMGLRGFVNNQRVYVRIEGHTLTLLDGRN